MTMPHSTPETTPAAAPLRRVAEFQSTPNPLALKCMLDRALDGPIRSFRSAAEAQADPLGRALFTIDGVTSLLLSTTWLTINKRTDASWDKIKPAVQRTLAATPDEAPQPRGT